LLESLRIERLAVVDAVEIELGAGLNVLTGETGAGKSIVLQALSLLAGGRASADAIRDGADDAVVEAVFSVADLPEVVAGLEARGLAPEDGALVVRRTLSRSGRHRARIGGETVPVSVLAELFGGRLEVSSQHESQALLRADTHGRLLDAYGGCLDRRAAVARAHARVRALDEEIAGLRAAAEERARREDFLAFQVREIDEAAPEAGEGERLAAERSRLAHAGHLREGAGEAWALLSGDPGAGADAGAVDLLARAVRAVEALAGYDDGLEPLAARLRDASVELGEVATELERYADGVEVDPARLAEVEERHALLEHLRRKYGADEAEVLAFRDAAARERAALEGAEAGLAKLEREREAALEALRAAARALSDARRRAARKLGRDVEAAVRGLALDAARFEVALEPAAAPEGLPCGPVGAEAAVFRFAADPAGTPRDLRRVASGGELSRVFLALKNVLRRADPGMVLVFDEVDAGIGGPVADRVGATLAELARAHQVLCITHLPQIAARADHHHRVRKVTRGGRSATEVSPLAGDARVEEIARMAGGAEVSEATRRHARDLLAARR